MGDLGSEDEELEEVPSVMESGNGPLQWVRSLVRNVRSAEPGKDNKKGKGKKGKGKDKGKKGKGRKAEKGKGNKKGKKNGNKKNGARKGGNRGKGKGGNKKKDSDSNKKKGRSGKDLKLLPEFLYNQLWCFDLAMEQALERCVEDKLQ